MEKYVTQEECEARRKELRENYEELKSTLSKTIGVSRVHTEQIGSMKDLIKWLAGITSGILVSVILLIIKGALNI